MGIISTGISQLLSAISSTISSFGNILPSIKLLGFLDILTIVLIIISGIVAFIIKHYARLNWGKFFIWWVGILLFLKFV